MTKRENEKNYKLKDIDIKTILERYGDDFIATFESLNLTLPNNENGFEKYYKRMKMVQYFIKIGLVGSFFFLVYNMSMALPNTIDWFTLLIISIPLSSMVAFMVFSYVFKKFKKSSFRLSSSLKYAVASLFSFYVISVYGMSYLNRTLEYSEQKELVVERKIIDKRKSTKGRDTYYFKFGYNYSQTITGDELRVPSKLFSEKEGGENIKIYIKTGYFNIQYIEDIR